jgi:hypothetical protein
MGETARLRPAGIRPYGRSWQHLEVTPGHWLFPRQRKRRPWRGFLAGEVRGATRSPARRRENLKVVSFAANRRRSCQSKPPESAHCPGHPLAGPAGKSFMISPAFSVIPAVGVSPRAAARLADVRFSRRDTAGAGGPGAQARAAPRHDRHGPNPQPPAQIRSDVPHGATR